MKRLIILACLALLTIVHVSSQDWPDWRGENRDGVWNDQNVISKFDEEPVEQLIFDLVEGVQCNNEAIQFNSHFQGNYVHLYQI